MPLHLLRHSPFDCFLRYLGDDEVNNRYLTIFTLLMPATVVAIPFVDAVLLRLGFYGGFQSINVLSLAYNIVKLSSHSLNVQVLGFVFFSFKQSFLFGVTFSYIPKLFAQGVVVAVEKLDGNFFIPNLVLTLLVLPCIGAALGIRHTIHQENMTKEGELG